MPNLTVALIQFNPIWEDSSANLAQLNQILEALDPATEMVLLPEMFNTGFSMNATKIAEKEDGLTYQWLQKKSKAYYIGGSFATKTEQGYANRFHLFYQGKLVGHYDKKYLFGLAKEETSYVPGDKPLFVTINSLNLAFFICYDLRFPEWIRNSTEYDVAVFVASWPQKRITHWDALLKARAIENQSYVLAVNRIGEDGNGIKHNGHSQSILPDGELIEKLENIQKILYVTIHKNTVIETRKKLPFLKDFK